MRLALEGELERRGLKLATVYASVSRVSAFYRWLWTRHDRAGRPGAPLTSKVFVETLKTYAREAGLPHVHLHQTRHTYARIVAEETDSFLEAQEALDHENAATMRVNVQHITVKRDRLGDKVAGRMKLARDEGKVD